MNSETQELGYYVYELAHPNKTPFYYGKGSGSRIHMHERDAERGHIDNQKKHDVIQHIWNSGEQVKKRKIAFFENEQDAYMYEWAMINMTCIADRLVNVSIHVETKVSVPTVEITEYEDGQWKHPIQTAAAVGIVMDIDRSTFSRAFKSGALREAAHRSGDTILIDTSHSDFLRWVQLHEMSGRAKGLRKIRGKIPS